MTIEAYQHLRQLGMQLAGGMDALCQRVGVYHHMYRDSGGRNVFPLIAAHVGLHAVDFYRKGALAGQLLSLLHVLWPRRRRALLASLAGFIHQFRDINRRVCAESYALYYYTRQYGHTAEIESVIGQDFAALLCRCHDSQRHSSVFAPEERAALFSAFFGWEQDHIVAPAVKAAFRSFDWPLIKALALRPKIEFAYFGRRNPIRFKNFSSKAERIAHGLEAYRRAEAIGLDRVEAALADYRIMPQAFVQNPQRYFDSVALAAGVSNSTSSYYLAR
ncbi:hypothetical protein [Leeia aquatica]|uniref:Uncharacterized protein n=1 Tax=Leeia aquatica TaxID=2725557 RepID=A0A847S9L1_9NEIS|nr:hypothetical protein [Leeia aquatica]NLR74256.1 hypothetical protein [Leeia aquatica]